MVSVLLPAHVKRFSVSCMREILDATALSCNAKLTKRKCLTLPSDMSVVTVTVVTVTEVTVTVVTVTVVRL